MTELNAIWRMLRRWWWLIILPPLVVAALSLPAFLGRGSAVSGGYAVQFKYTAAQQTSNLPPRDGDYQDVWLASEYTVNAFTEWIRSSTFRQELGAVLGNQANLGALGIATDNQRSIGQVQMSHPDSAQLEAIAAAALVVLQTRNQAYFPHLGEQPALVTVIDAPVVTPAPPPLTNRFEPLIRVAIGLAGGLALAVAFEYADRRVRYNDDIERYGLRVLGRIPRS
jgi:capsular polysaccharide biosynthesis protein